MSAPSGCAWKARYVQRARPRRTSSSGLPSAASWAWLSRRVIHRVIVHESDAGLAAAWRAKQREAARRDSTRAAAMRSRRSTLELAATCDHAPHLMNDHVRRDMWRLILESAI